MQTGFTYEGQFENGLKQGEGKYFESNGKYSYEGVFIDDKPECKWISVIYNRWGKHCSLQTDFDRRGAGGRG